ncbi:MAG TPA: hypothetical protein VJH97_05285 [Candidatus Nanoarchaeia archaeon]|nr:hypothetical protein [Candidatus Nanoarchaeia archaeon]
MIDTKDFKKIEVKLASYDSQREHLIKKARDVLKLSKQLIYAAHRGDKKEASELYQQAQNEKKALDKIASADPKLYYEGSYSQAIQEYVEALAYHDFSTAGKIPTVAALKVDEEDYLSGIADLTGELTRKAVTVANKEPKEVERIKDVVEEIFGQFLKFNLRNGDLRKKADQIKWNLKKLEELEYDVNKVR